MHLLTLWFTTYLGNPFETNFGAFCTSANCSPKLLSRLPRVLMGPLKWALQVVMHDQLSCIREAELVLEIMYTLKKSYFRDWVMLEIETKQALCVRVIVFRLSMFTNVHKRNYEWHSERFHRPNYFWVFIQVGDNLSGMWRLTPVFPLLQTELTMTMIFITKETTWEMSWLCECEYSTAAYEIHENGTNCR